MDASASTLAPEIGGVKLGCASNPMRVLNRLLAPFRSIKRLNIRNFTGLALGYGAGNNKDLSAITNAPIGQNV